MLKINWLRLNKHNAQHSKSEITETQLKSYRRKDFPKTATVFAFGDKKKSGL